MNSQSKSSKELRQRQPELLVNNFVATTSRLVGDIAIGVILTPLLLNQLGLQLFGLVATVGASGLLFTFATNTLQTSMMRELGLCVGRDDLPQLQRVFTASTILQLGIAVAFLVVGLAGTPWIAAVLTIPEGYELATQFAIGCTFTQLSIGIAASPFGALLRAHQDLKVVASLQFMSRLLTLGAAVMIVFLPQQKFTSFVLGAAIASVTSQLTMIVIARRRFPEVSFRFDGPMMQPIRSMFSYGVFSFIGTAGLQLRRQGVSLFLNVAFDNAVAGANGIAYRVSQLVSQVTQSVGTVIRPAIQNSTGAENRAHTERLASLATTLSLCISLPITVFLMIDTRLILTTWLRQEPTDLTLLFSRITVITLFTQSLSRGMNLAMHADGRIARLVLTNQLLSLIPMLGCAAFSSVQSRWPWLVLAGELAGSLISACVFQPWWVSRLLAIEYRTWIWQAVSTALGIGAVCFLVRAVYESMGLDGIVPLVLVGLLAQVISVAVFLHTGLSGQERKRVWAMVLHRIGASRPSQ